MLLCVYLLLNDRFPYIDNLFSWTMPFVGFNVRNTFQWTKL